MERQPDGLKTKDILSMAISSNTTTSSAVFDSKDFNGLFVSVKSGTLTDGDYNFKIVESDDSGFSAPTDVPSDQVSTLPVFAPADDDTLKDVAAVGKMRYFRIDAISTNVTTGGSFTLCVTVSGARKAPTVETA